jgi:hypothetical protein
MNLKNYEANENGRDFADLDIVGAINFLKDFDPASMDSIEIEMCLMHAAYILNSSNQFVDNYNVRLKEVFIDHVSLMTESDISAWSRKLNDYNLWQNGSTAIANIAYNWIRGSLNDPEVLIP